MTDEPVMCAECGDTSGRIQSVAIAWPGKEPYFKNIGPLDINVSQLGDKYMPNPKANGKFVTLWLHPECEKDAIERLEKEDAK